jgi:hypothetical protein
MNQTDPRPFALGFTASNIEKARIEQAASSEGLAIATYLRRLAMLDWAAKQQERRVSA